MQNTAVLQKISRSQGVIPDLFKLEQLRQLKAKKCLGKGRIYYQTDLLLQSIKLTQKD